MGEEELEVQLANRRRRNVFNIHSLPNNSVVEAVDDSESVERADVLSNNIDVDESGLFYDARVPRVRASAGGRRVGRRAYAADGVCVRSARVILQPVLPC